MCTRRSLLSLVLVVAASGQAFSQAPTDQKKTVENPRAALKADPTRLDAALADFRAALATASTDTDKLIIHLRRAELYYREKRFVEAIADYTVYLSRMPHPDIHAYRARAFAYGKVYPINATAAINDLRVFLERKPDDAEAWEYLACVYFTGGVAESDRSQGIENAIAAANHATALDPTLARAFLVLGDGYSLRSQFTEARDAYTRYLALRPNDKFGYDGRGRVLFNGKDYAGAVKDFEKELTLLPPDSQERDEILRLRNACLARLR